MKRIAISCLVLAAVFSASLIGGTSAHAALPSPCDWPTYEHNRTETSQNIWINACGYTDNIYISHDNLYVHVYTTTNTYLRTTLVAPIASDGTATGTPEIFPCLAPEGNYKLVVSSSTDTEALKAAQGFLVYYQQELYRNGTCEPDPPCETRLDENMRCMTAEELAQARRCASSVSTQRGLPLGARVLIVARRFCGKNGKGLYAHVVRVSQRSGRVLGVRSIRVGVLRGAPASLRARVVLLTKRQRTGLYRIRYTLRPTYRRSDPFFGYTTWISRR